MCFRIVSVGVAQLADSEKMLTPQFWALNHHSTRWSALLALNRKVQGIVFGVLFQNCFRRYGILVEAQD